MNMQTADVKHFCRVKVKFCAKVLPCKIVAVQKYHLRAYVSPCKSVVVQNCPLGVNSTLCKSGAHAKMTLSAKVTHPAKKSTRANVRGAILTFP